MEEDNSSSFSDTPPTFRPSNFVTLSPISHIPTNPRRLSRTFAKPKSPIKFNGRRKMAWVSLQGRLVGAEEATSARAIGVGLSPEEAVTWELFSPIERVLIVAVVAAAAAKCEKHRQISQLRKCVQLRDQILMSMQEKLDNLCDQMNSVKDQPQAVAVLSAPKSVELPKSEFLFKSDSACTDCWLCEQHRAQLNDSWGNSLVKAASSDELLKSRLSISNEAVQEERRMSDLSDWASSVTSAADLQLNNLAVEQDIYNLKKQCEEKDDAIKELSSFIRSKDVATSKRIEELEEIIRRKNSMIMKFRKDMIVLEQKVVSLTRMRRRSFSGVSSSEKKQFPTMTDNLLYDMDSPSGSSSSDSDYSSKKKQTLPISENEVQIPVDTPVHSSFTCENDWNKNQSAPAKLSFSSAKPSPWIPRSRPVTPIQQKSVNQRLTSATSPRLSNAPRPVTPLQEKSLNQRLNSAASPRMSPAPASSGSKNNRRRAHTASSDSATLKRWM